MPASLKVVKDLAPGDRVLIQRSISGGHLGGGLGIAVTVLGVVPSVQTIRRKVVLVTFRDSDDHEIHHTYNEHTTVHMIPPEEGAPS